MSERSYIGATSRSSVGVVYFEPSYVHVTRITTGCYMVTTSRSVNVKGSLFCYLQAPDEGQDGAVEPGMRPCRHRHPGGRREEADARETPVTPRPGSREVR